MRVKVTNLTKIDIAIDVNGENKPEDKVILHPKNTEILTIKASVYPVIKGTQGVVVHVLDKE